MALLTIPLKKIPSSSTQQQQKKQQQQQQQKKQQKQQKLTADTLVNKRGYKYKLDKLIYKNKLILMKYNIEVSI